MRYLAIDPGDRRTGLAVGGDDTQVITPTEVIITADPDERLRRIAAAIEEHGPDALVLGLPLNMDGSEGPAAKKSHGLAAKLTERFGLPVRLVDERLSSAAADDMLDQTGLKREKKKSRHDAVAAALILRAFLDDG